ncbi:MAG: hypothetical protein H7326_03005 [Bdellovibrionaceae bacterium]|nr:hypothetical protein [Pseudobdellovibrionaceae bacterium]
MKSVFLAIFGTIVLSAAITQAERKEDLSTLVKLNFAEAPTCDGRPEFITEVRPQILGGFEKLPKLVLVASESDYYIESKSNGGDVRIHSYQSFRSASAKEKSKIICGSSKTPESGRFALFAPTLIDTTLAKKVGQSLWQFQMLTDKRGFSVWNQRSLAFSENESLEKNVLQFGGNYRIYQLSPDQYEVVISKDEGGLVQYLSVKYDVVKNF